MNLRTGAVLFVVATVLPATSFAANEHGSRALQTRAARGSNQRTRALWTRRPATVARPAAHAPHATAPRASTPAHETATSQAASDAVSLAGFHASVDVRYGSHEGAPAAFFDTKLIAGPHPDITHKVATVVFKLDAKSRVVATDYELHPVPTLGIDVSRGSLGDLQVSAVDSQGHAELLSHIKLSPHWGSPISGTKILTYSRSRGEARAKCIERELR